MVGENLRRGISRTGNERKTDFPQFEKYRKRVFYEGINMWRKLPN